MGAVVKKNKTRVSFCIPCYRSEKTVPAVVAEIDAAMEALPAYDWEIIMVNDGAPNACWEKIKKLCRERENRHGICFAKNFGQHAALMAAIRKAGGEILVCLDDDGQTPASEVGKFLAKIEEGADVVYADYDQAHSSAYRSFGTKVNDWMCCKLLGKPKELHVSSYFAMRRFVAEEVKKYENSYPYLLGLVLRTSSSIVNVPVTHRSRTSGKSGYTFSKLFGLWLNGFTAFSIKPLRAATFLGTIFALLGFVYGIYTIIKKIVNPAVPMGFSALMTAIIFFGGMLMLMVGLAGEYIGRTYISVSSAPQYVIRNETEDVPSKAKEDTLPKDAEDAEGGDRKTS